jgi:large subunit ribosomal protein L15
VKLHDLRPAPGSRKAKRRVGRGIAAGQGKTAGRGTKGQKSRAGGNLPAWFEGGQTPLHQRIPKLRGFRNPFKIEYEIVNLGAIARLVELGAFESGEHPASPKKGPKAAPITVNQEILRGAGLIRTLDKPMKVLGQGELSTALFVVADAFSSSARAKIEAAGGSVSVLEVPGRKTKALGVDKAGRAEAAAPAESAAPSKDAAAEAPDVMAEAPVSGSPEAVAEAPAAETPAMSVPEPAAEPAPGLSETAAKPKRAAKATVSADGEPEPEKPAKPAKATKAAGSAKATTGKATAKAAVAKDADAETAAPKPTRARKAAPPAEPDADEA